MTNKMPPVLIWRIVLALIMLALVALVLIGKARAQVVNAGLARSPLLQLFFIRTIAEQRITDR